MVTKYCLPYLRKSKNAHVLNISPPLNMETQWFAPHVAYTMAKYGMSLCVLVNFYLKIKSLLSISSVGNEWRIKRRRNCC